MAGEASGIERASRQIAVVAGATDCGSTTHAGRVSLGTGAPGDFVLGERGGNRGRWRHFGMNRWPNSSSGMSAGSAATQPDRAGQRGLRAFSMDRSRRCTVYEARPRQCRTWPFWDSNLKRPEDSRHTCQVCPGSGQGKLHSIEVIEAQRKVFHV
jgi:hypothetical protein